MTRPKLLDLFCGAGGCAMGYHRAGFDCTGIDNRPMPRYPFRFVYADALEYVAERGHDFDVIHASPPCQAYSAANNIHGRTDHPDLVAVVRDLLIATGKTYVIENVPRSPLRNAVMVCGLSLGLNVKRHRLFESNVLLFGTTCRDHHKDYAIVFGGGARGRTHQVGRTEKGGPILPRPTIRHAKASEAMGIDWMTRDELSQAIPPAYTHYIGRQLIRLLENH